MSQAIIEIQDEVNVKFRGLSSDLIERAKKTVTWTVPGFAHMPMYRSGRWDGTISLMSNTGKTYLNLLDRMLPMLESAGVEFEIEDNRHDWSSVVDQIVLPDQYLFSEHTWDGTPDGEPIVLRDYQLDAVHAALLSGQGLLEMATGAGKAQPLTSTVMTPSGPVRMGDIQVGDQVSTVHGGVTTVTGVFPQGVKTLYEIEFQDGRVVQCCDEHLWWVYDKRTKRHNKKRGLDRFEVLPAKTIKSILDQNPGTALQIPLSPTYHDERVLPVHPYLLGALLGDGSLCTASYTFTTMDDDIMHRVREHTVEDGDDWIDTNSENSGKARSYRLRNTTQGTRRPHLKAHLMHMGLDKARSDTKFIPPEYLLASIDQRWDLIRGLMDTDGYVSRYSNTSYSTSSKTLALSVQQLIRSVGGIAKITERSPFYTTDDGTRVPGKLSYTVNIQVIDPTMLFSCSRKLERTRTTQYSDGLALRIVAVREIGTAPMQCISVDDPTRIYITDHYTVTHNTITCAALASIYSQFGKVIVLVPSIDLAIQTQAVFKKVGLDPGIWYSELKDARQITISTWQSMDHFPELMAGVVCVIVDEAHQAKAKTIGEIMTGPACNVPFRFGCTGTVPKEDLSRNQIAGAIGTIIFTLSAWELQQRGVLASSVALQINMKDSLNNRYRMAPTFDDWSDQLAWQFGDPDRVAAIVAILIDYAENEGNTLVFVPNKEHGKILERAIPGSVSLDGDDKPSKRQKYYKWFNDNDNNVLICTYGIASTGLDIPRINVLGFIEPGKKFEKIIQSIGRGLRKAEDKDHVTLLDFCGDTDFSKKHAASRRKLYKDAHIICHIEDFDYANS